MIKVDRSFFHRLFPKRKADAHKGDFGRILIFSGSCGMAGAAVLSGRAALRSGAGLTRFLLPSFEDPIYPVLQVSVPEATCVIPGQIGNINEYQAVAAGSGLGSSSERCLILKQILRDYEGKLILDADALNMVARGEIAEEEIRQSPARILFTPHIGEAKRLLGRDCSIRTKEERIEAATELAEKYQSTILLKGPGTLILSLSSSGRTPAAKADIENMYQNTTGGPGMATAGSGDVLSGIIAAFAGQGLSLPEAAACGAYIHGKAGDLAAEALGEVCMNASDLIRYLPAAWKAF